MTCQMLVTVRQKQIELVQLEIVCLCYVRYVSTSSKTVKCVSLGIIDTIFQQVNFVDNSMQL